MKCKCPHCGGNLEINVQAEVSPLYDVLPLKHMYPHLQTLHSFEQMYHAMLLGYPVYPSPYDLNEWNYATEDFPPDEAARRAIAARQRQNEWGFAGASQEAPKRVWLPDTEGSQDPPKET